MWHWSWNHSTAKNSQNLNEIGNNSLWQLFFHLKSRWKSTLKYNITILICPWPSSCWSPLSWWTSTFDIARFTSAKYVTLIMKSLDRWKITKTLKMKVIRSRLDYTIIRSQSFFLTTKGNTMDLLKAIYSQIWGTNGDKIDATRLAKILIRTASSYT